MASYKANQVYEIEESVVSWSNNKMTNEIKRIKGYEYNDTG